MKLEDQDLDVKFNLPKIASISRERLEFLALLPILLNSSLDTHEVISLAIEQLQSEINAEAVTVFLLTHSTDELTFWALKGAESVRLEGKKMPSNSGLVGWVIDKQESLLIANVKKDPRFFSDIDEEGNFCTTSIICTPLLVRGKKIIGAIQALNKEGEQSFCKTDLNFVEQFSHQVAMAIENANLYEDAKSKSKQLAIIDWRKKEIISIISHEFRTPLNLIQNASEMLTMDILDGLDKTQISHTLITGVKKLDSLISQIRDVAQVTEEKLKLNRKNINVRLLLDKTKLQFQQIADQRNQDLSIFVDEKVELVNADSTLLLVVLKNLISNAIRFSPDGKSITLTAKRTCGQVEFSVKDEGIGIPKNQIPCIFEKFYEVGDLLKHSSGNYEFKSAGLGLGLATVKAILEAHKSSIDVESEMNQGSVFRFRLPVP
ncbi:GAF domain-containing sensor histidine kinase [candidate division KSB1 bacterium]|nr:GAF domain-containing sensor histidine kinase [candidate division KSB1 bacterium]